MTCLYFSTSILGRKKDLLFCLSRMRALLTKLFLMRGVGIYNTWYCYTSRVSGTYSNEQNILYTVSSVGYGKKNTGDYQWYSSWEKKFPSPFRQYSIARGQKIKVCLSVDEALKYAVRQLKICLLTRIKIPSF